MSSETCNRVGVERYFLDEASGEEKRRIGDHLAGCPRCKDHLDTLSRERQGYLAAHPFPAFSARHLEAKAPRANFLPGPRWLPGLAGALACLAVAAALQWPRHGGEAPAAEGGSEAGDRIAYKGGETFEFHYRRDGKVLEGSLHDSFQAGDELQFVFTAGRFSHIALASVDSRGKVSLYRRAEAAEGLPASIPAEAGRLQTFPFAVTLDASPGQELFVLILGMAPMEAGTLETWLADSYRAGAEKVAEKGAGRKAVDGAETGGMPGELDGLAAGLQPPALPGGAMVKTLLLRKAST